MQHLQLECEHGGVRHEGRRVGWDTALGGAREFRAVNR